MSAVHSSFACLLCNNATVCHLLFHGHPGACVLRHLSIALPGVMGVFCCRCPLALCQYNTYCSTVTPYHYSRTITLGEGVCFACFLLTAQIVPLAFVADDGA